MSEDKITEPLDDEIELMRVIELSHMGPGSPDDKPIDVLQQEVI